MKPTRFLAATFAAAAPFFLGSSLIAEEEAEPKGVRPEAKAWVDGLRPLRVIGDSRLRHAGEISRIEPLSDGKRAVVTAGDGTARLWDLTTGEELRRYSDGAKSYVWMALVLPGDKQILTTGASNGVTLWDLETGEELKKFDHGSATYRVTLAPDRKSFFAVDSGDKGIFWNLETGEKIREIKPKTGGFYTCFYLDEGKVMVTGGDDETLTFWEVSTGKKLSEVKEKETKDIFTLTLSGDGSRFAMCCEGKTLRLREAKQDGKELWQQKFPNAVRVAAWSPDGKMIGATCDDHVLYVLNSEDGAFLHKLPVGKDSDYAVAFTRDGNEIIGASEHVIFRFDVKTGKRTFPKEGDPVLSSGVNSMAVSKAGEIFVSGDGTDILVFDGEKVGRAPVRRIATTSSSPTHLAVSPDGKKLVFANGSSREIHVIDTESGKKTKQLAPANSVKSLLFAGDDRIVVSTSGSQVEMWDLKAGTKTRTFSGHTESVDGISIAGDQKRLATFSDDGTIRMWDLTTGVQVDGVGIGDPEASNRDFIGGTFFGAKGRGILANRRTMLDYWEAPEVVEEKFDPEAFEKLYADLNSHDFKTRELATRRLIGMGNGALKEIEKRFEESGESIAELKLRLERVRGGIAGSSKMGKAKGTLGMGSGFGGIASFDRLDLWIALEGTSAEATIVIGDIHEGAPRVLRRMGDGHGPGVFVLDGEKGQIIAGNRDGTVTVWGTE